MKIGVLKEVTSEERRVALIPESIKRLVAKKIEFLVQSEAGKKAGASNEAYQTSGGQIVPDAERVFAEADVVLKIHAPTAAEVALLRKGQTLVCMLSPMTKLELVKSIADRGASALSVDSIPRSSVAQMMDVLSSQAALAGYRAVLLAAEALPKLFPMMMTAAGTLAPAKVIVLGAGVAGLQAIATARRLGASVEAFDVRKVAKEQVESLGAKFVEVAGGEDAQTAGGYAKEVSDEYKKKQAALLLERIGKSDVCITTAQIPGKQAPILVTEEMVKAMKPGSVIVDLAAEQGGNVVGTKAGQRVNINDVMIIGDLNLPSHLSVHASQMYSRNMEKLIVHLCGSEGSELRLDLDDEIVKAVVTVRNGTVVDERLKGKV